MSKKEELPYDPEEIRDVLHNIDLTDPDRKEFYYSKLTQHITKFEGFKPHAYDDKDSKASPINIHSQIKGNITIGIGFNMNRREAKDEWTKAFGERISFDEAKKGLFKLELADAQKLLREGILIRDKQLEKLYHPHWNKFRADQQLVIADLYFRGDKKLAGSTTKFRKNMMDYIETGNDGHLDKALNQVKNHSNGERLAGNIARNAALAKILDSRQCPFYSNYKTPLVPEKRTVFAKLEKTVIPKGAGDHSKPNSEFIDYFIWRTRMDGKVRPDHAPKEGKIYRRSENDFSDYNCRCYAEPMPINVKVVLPSAITKSEQLLREVEMIKSRIRLKIIEKQIFAIKNTLRSRYKDFPF